MKETILFISQPIYEDKICAIGVSGKLFADAFLLSEKYNTFHFYAESGQQVVDLYNQYKPKIIFYMFCTRTTAWMMENSWKNEISCKNVVLDADVTQRTIINFKPESFYNFDALVSIDPSLDISYMNNVYKVNHIMPNVQAPEYVDTGIIKIGFHGSPTLNKGILDLVDFVQNEFDNAEIKFHCPLRFPNNGHSSEELMNNINAVKNKIYKKGISFHLTTDIITNQELVNRLSQNTINCYFNVNGPYHLTGSAIHTALASRRPIAIRKSRASKAYLHTNPSICIEDNSLTEIINNGFLPLEQLYEKFSPVNVCKDFEKIIYKLLQPPGLSFSL